MDMTPVLCLGEALIDVVTRVGPEGSGDRNGTAASTESVEHVGGSPLNVACGVARLGHPVRMGSWWGTDERGLRISEHARSHGVELVPGTDGAARTSVAHAAVDADGQATYEFDIDWQVPAASHPVGDPTPALGHLHVGSLGAYLAPGADDVVAIARAYAERGTVSFDPNIRPTLLGSRETALPRVEELVALSSVVKASAEDVAWLYGDLAVPAILDRWGRLGATLAVITDGGAGALARVELPVPSTSSPDPLIRSAATFVQVAPLQVEVADTVGAGDSFMAGLVSGLLDAGLLGEREAMRPESVNRVLPALRRAAMASGVTVSRHGAYSPTREDIA